MLYGQVHGQPSLCFTTSFIALTGHRLPRAPHNTPPHSHLTLVSQPVGLPSISILIEASELAAFWRQRGAIHHGRRGHVTWDLGPRDA